MASALRASAAQQVASRPVSVRRASVRRSAKVVCTAQKEESVKQLGTAVAAAALATVVGFGSVDAAYADVAGLTPCSESKAYAKREKNEIKSLTKRLKQYQADSAPALALNATMERTQKRFAMYAKSGVLCGTDGLPHLIADPGLALKYGHAGEIFLPTIGFLYIAGYIGYVGREYLMATKEEKTGFDKEYIIDVPMALSMVYRGGVWPLKVISELRAGTLTEKEENITVSPR